MSRRELCCGRCYAMTGSSRAPGLFDVCGECGATLRVGERYSVRLGFCDVKTRDYFAERVARTPGVTLYWCGRDPSVMGLAAWLWADDAEDAFIEFQRQLSKAHGGLCSSVDIFLRDVEALDDEEVPPPRLQTVEERF